MCFLNIIKINKILDKKNYFALFVCKPGKQVDTLGRNNVVAMHVNF